ncbi:MAG: sulfurtransferase complex subunit TusC [Aeromonas sp.]
MQLSHRIAVITRQAPHGSSAAREGLDALLATSALCDDLALFFIGDGVYQLVANQAPQAILQRHIAPTFKLLELYDIEPVYVCADSLAERGLTAADLLLAATCLPRAEIAATWATYSQHISF